MSADTDQNLCSTTQPELGFKMDYPCNYNLTTSGNRINIDDPDRNNSIIVGIFDADQMSTSNIPDDAEKITVGGSPAFKWDEESTVWVDVLKGQKYYSFKFHHLHSESPSAFTDQVIESIEFI